MGKGILADLIEIDQGIFSCIDFNLECLRIPSHKILQKYILNDCFPEYYNNKTVSSHLVPIQLLERNVFYKVKAYNCGNSQNNTGNIEYAKRIVEVDSFQNSFGCLRNENEH